MKRYLFLFVDEAEFGVKNCLGEEWVEASGMYEALTEIKKIANHYVNTNPRSLKIELKEVQYFEDAPFIEVL